MTDYGKRILESIDILVGSAMSAAKFDQTVTATVDSCVDAATGRYKIKYQDATYMATSENLNSKYENGASVYILVPEGDFTKPKKIQGLVTGSAASGIESVDNLITSWGEVGNNIITMPEDYEIGICSHKCKIENEGFKVLYDKTQSTNLIQVDNEAFKNTIKSHNCKYFYLGADFKTNLDISHQDRGEYFLLITFSYKDVNNNDRTQSYKFGLNNMEGNPYLLTDWTFQKIVCELPVGEIQEIDSIVFVAEDFSPQLTDRADLNIFVRNLKLAGAAQVTSSYFNFYDIKFKASHGLTFNNTITSTTVEPLVTYQGQTVDISKAEIYWFRENANITTNHHLYTRYGGKGWLCLNTATPSYTDDHEVYKYTFTSSQKHEFQQSVGQNRPYEMTYKCVIVLPSGAEIFKTFSILDESFTYKMIMESSAGLEFSEGQQSTTLNVKFVDANNNLITTLPNSTDDAGKTKIKYSWQKTSNIGEVESLYYYDKDNKLVNQIDTLNSIRYHSNYLNYNIVKTCQRLNQLIEDGYATNLFRKDKQFETYDFKLVADSSITPEQQAKMDEIRNFLSGRENSDYSKIYVGYLKGALEKTNNNTMLTHATWDYVQRLINAYNVQNDITYLSENIFYELPAQLVTGTELYTCSAWIEEVDGSQFPLGTVSTALTYNHEIQTKLKAWYTSIINGDQVFKYDPQGRSPFYKTTQNPNPQQVKALRFQVFDGDGKQIPDEKISTQGTDAIITSWDWIVPASHTLIDLRHMYSISELEHMKQEDDTYKISNVKELNFAIKTNFDESATSNKIQLKVYYNTNKTMHSFTNFSFIKDGLSGTNGTDYYCKVSPNTVSISEWPAIVAELNTEGTHTVKLNFIVDGEDNSKWVKAELYNNTEQVNANDLKVVWSMKQNEYYNTATNSIEKTQSHFVVGNENGSDSTLGTGRYVSLNDWPAIDHPSNIIQAKVTYKPEQDKATTTATSFTQSQTIYGSLPLDTIIHYHVDYQVRIAPLSGYNEVLYGADGRNPEYSNKPFEVQVFKRNSNNEFDYNDNIAGLEDVNTALGAPFNCVFSIYGHNTMFSISNWKDLNANNASPPNNTCKVIPKPVYSGVETNCGIRVDVFQTLENGEQGHIATIFHPIQLLLNKYGNSALNDWNGNSISLDNANGVILAPQVGAGYKDTGNTFTGLVMGTQRKSSSSSFKDETGLMGYKMGERTIFLDAETGKAEFGRAGSGQIILHPGVYDTATNKWTNTQAVLRSGGYVEQQENYDGTIKTPGSGLLIDLTTPEIKFGNKNFVVDKDGVLRAKTAYLGSWVVNDTAIFNPGIDAINKAVNEIYDNSPTKTFEMGSVYGENIATLPADQELEDAAIETESVDDVHSFGDGKHRTFTGPDAPTPPYSVGDLWYVTTNTGAIDYVDNGVTKTVIENHIKICVQSRWFGEQIADTDWENHGTYVAGESFVDLQKAYQSYAESEAKKVDDEMQAYLQNGGGTTWDDSKVITPYLGGGYLNIVDPTKDSKARFVVDPNNRGNTSMFMAMYNKAGELAFGIERENGRAYLGATPTESGYGGWKIGSSRLIANSKGSLVALQAGGNNTNPNSIAIAAGFTTELDKEDNKVAITEAPFRVTHEGALHATKAYIEGEVQATSGKFNGEITATKLTIASNADVSGLTTNNISGMNGYATTGDLANTNAAVSGLSSTVSGHDTKIQESITTANNAKLAIDAVTAQENNTTVIDGAKILTGSIGASKLVVGGGGNLYATGYDTFEHITNNNLGYSIATSGSFEIVDNSVTQPYYGTKCLRIISNSGDTYGHLGAKENGWGSIPVEANQTYLISMWVKTNVAQSTVQIWVVRRTGRTQANAEGGMKNYSRTINTANKWTRVYCEYTAESGYPYIGLRLDNDSVGSTIYVDAIQIEKAEPGQQPGSFSPAGMTVIDGGHIATGTITALGNVQAGSFSLGSGKFAVTNAGYLTSTSGTIGGFTINSSYLANASGKLGEATGTGGTGVYIGLDGISCGHNTFQVTKDGSLSASKVNITGGTLNINDKFIVANTGQVTLKDTFSLGDESGGDDNDNADPDYGAAMLKTNAYSGSTVQYQSTVGPNRITFYDKGSDLKNDKTSAAIYFIGAKGKAYVSDSGGGNYLYFTKSIGLYGSRAFSGTSAPTTKDGWNNITYTGIRGRNGIPVVMQGYMKESTWFSSAYTGYTIEFGVSRSNAATDGYNKGIRETILKGRNLFLLAFGNAASSGYEGIINILGKTLNCNASANFTGGATISSGATINGGATVNDGLTANKIYLTDPGTTYAEKIDSTDYRVVRQANTSKQLLVYAPQTSSSRSIKRDITLDINSDLNPNKLYDIDIYQFKYKPQFLEDNDYRQDKDLLGFIIEELYKQYPIAVAVNKNNEPTAWEPAYLIPPMLKLIQDQKKEIDELKEQLTNQQQQIDYILSKLG